jgi:molybdenum cofactor synthesis domain-containing protein
MKVSKIKIRAAAITVSDQGAAGKREDLSGPLLVDALTKMGAEVAGQKIVADDREKIAHALITFADEMKVDLIITTGGTGPALRDLTPEATRAVIDREIDGIAEALRFTGYNKTPLAVLSRGIAGLRGRCLIVNLPGHPRAVCEGMEILIPILPHALQMIRGEQLEHG